MKTPIQEFYEFMEQHQYFIGNDLYEKYKELLKKEKEVMCGFQELSQRTDYWVHYDGSEDCFDKTFKTKER